MSIAIIITILMTIFLLFLYYRYIPVKGINKLTPNSGSCKEDVAIVDTRDFQSSCIDIIDQAYCIPVPYLKRHFHDIPDKNIVVIASDNVGKNMSARFLRNRGRRVVGYYLKD